MPRNSKDVKFVPIPILFLFRIIIVELVSEWEMFLNTKKSYLFYKNEVHISHRFQWQWVWHRSNCECKIIAAKFSCQTAGWSPCERRIWVSAQNPYETQIIVSVINSPPIKNWLLWFFIHFQMDHWQKIRIMLIHI